MTKVRIARWATVVLAAAVVGGLAPAPVARAAEAKYDFEKCEQGWSVSPPATGERSWQRLPLGEGGGFAMAFPLYEGDSTAWVGSPPHPSTGAPVKVTFSVRWQHEDPATGIDTFKVEWSTDLKSKEWKRLKVFGGTTNPAFPNYQKESVMFTPPPGTFVIRFTMGSDALVAGLGPQIDNVVIPAAAPKAATCA